MKKLILIIIAASLFSQEPVKADLVQTETAGQVKVTPTIPDSLAAAYWRERATIAETKALLLEKQQMLSRIEQDIVKSCGGKHVPQDNGKFVCVEKK